MVKVTAILQLLIFYHPHFIEIKIHSAFQRFFTQAMCDLLCHYVEALDRLEHTLEPKRLYFRVIVQTS